MSKVNYYLKNALNELNLEQLKKENRKAYNDELNVKRPIIMSVAYNGRRDIFTTGKFISRRLWDKNSKRIKVLLETPKNSIDDGIWLDAKKIEVEKLLQLAKSEYRIVTRDELHGLIQSEVKIKKSINTLKEVLKQFSAEHKTSKGASLKKNTLKKYAALIVHITGFQGNDLFTPQLYSTTWIKKFKEYLMVTAKSNDNTVCKYIIALKTFFKHFKRKGISISAAMDEIKVAETEQIVNIIEMQELLILEQMEFETPSHNQIRDVFLFQCYTGARYSDIYNTKRQDIKLTDGMSEWDYIDEKTGHKITAPLSIKAQKILDKYLHLPTPLPRYTNQAINRELKKIAKKANLDRKVKLIAYHDNNKTETTCCLHEIISTHMARRTFISLSLQLGVRERLVREISGHKDERSFRRYINLSKSHLVAVSNAWNSINKAS